MNTRIIIDRFHREGEFKKYQSTQEEIRQNREANNAQRARDDAARREALRDSESSANQNANEQVSAGAGA
ncbi:MAG TPA: hypothetical protein VN956_16965 [Pyrinomonadaceae bacterium]|nr:hypothetical protein [Pyrinomonadaceae bacterium]